MASNSASVRGSIGESLAKFFVLAMSIGAIYLFFFFTPTEDQSDPNADPLVTIARTDRTGGADEPLISCDGTVLARMPLGTFFEVKVTDGAHTFRVGQHGDEKTLQTKRGKAYYLALYGGYLSAKGSFGDFSDFSRVDDADLAMKRSTEAVIRGRRELIMSLVK